MPAFTFERLSPPVRRGEVKPAETKQRGRIVQLLDRFSEVRTKRALGKDSVGPDPQKPPK